MKEFEDLTQIELRILVRFCEANNYSLSSHVPIEAVNLKLKGENSKYIRHKYIRRAIEELRASGFIVKHPTGRQTTYNISKKGLRAGTILRNDE